MVATSDFIKGWEFILFDYSQYLRQRGYDVVWIAYCVKPVTLTTSLGGIELQRIEAARFPWYNPLAFMIYVAQFVRMLRMKKVRLVYTRVASLGTFASLASKILRIPFVYHAEDLEADLAVADLGGVRGYLSALLSRLSQRFAAHSSEAILTVSNSFKSYLVAKWRIPNKKIHVLYEGVPTQIRRLRSKRIETIKDLVYLGGPNPHDGIDLTIEAFAIVRRVYPRIRLTVAVFTPKTTLEKYRKLATDLKVAGHVRFAFGISGEDARRLVRSKDIGIIARRNMLSTRLTTSSVLFLYISEGIPVVAPQLPAIREVLDSPELLFKPGDSESLAKRIEAIISDESLAGHLKLSMSVLAKKFDRSISCRKLQRLLFSLMNGNKAS
jgi:glycosyltransferase involved in cell wall biosynthesis